MQWWQWFLWITLGLLVLLAISKPVLIFVVMPIITHRNGTLAATITAQQADLQSMTPETRQATQLLIEQFEAEGFEFRTAITWPSAVPNVHSIEVVLVNAVGDMAVILVTYAEHLRQTTLEGRTLTINVWSRFEDGREVLSVVNREPNIWPPNPMIDRVTFSWLRDAHSLCEVHRRRLAKLGRDNAKRISVARGEEMIEDEKDWVRSMQWPVQRGYLYLDAKGAVYRYSWKGAFLSVWKLAPPIGRWRVKSRDRHSRRIWRELGMDQWQAANATATAGEEIAEPAREASLAYEPQLPKDEVHMHHAAGALTVRIGRPSRTDYLAGEWLALSMTGIILLALVWAAYAVWVLRYPLHGSMYVLLVALALEVPMLVIGLLKHRGTTVLVATERGLSFRNAPQLRPHGHVVRDEIELLAVAPVYGFMKRSYRLLLRERAGRTHVLAGMAKRDSLEQMRQALLEAMGLARPTVAA